MPLHNLTNYNDLVVYHMNKSRDLLSNLLPKKKALYWSNADTFYQKYKANDILVFWGLADEIPQLFDTYPNNSFVFATGDYYYMDCGFGNKYGGNSWCDPFKTWWKIYSFEPSDYNGTNGTRPLVLGSEIAVWSELNGDENIHAKLWPRGAALSDRLWSENIQYDLIKISQRQIKFAEYLKDRGTPTSPITGRYCEKFADQCFGTKQKIPVKKQGDNLNT